MPQRRRAVHHLSDGVSYLLKRRLSSGRLAFALVFIGLLLASSAVAAAQAPGKAAKKGIDWDLLNNEAIALLIRYIRLDTTNPPGNELAAARMLREKFLGDGIPAVTIQPAPQRGIVAARLHGTGHGSETIVLLSHMDVVPAEPQGWKEPPFSGAIRDGQIWGRGALDDKGPGVIALMAMLAIKRAGILLKRDVLFVATGDEEQGGKLGTGWLVEHRPDLFADAHYVLNEGGAIRVLPNGRKFYAVSVAEKNPLWLKLVASGAPGHGSKPEPETAVSRLVQALYRISQMQNQINVLPLVQAYFYEIGSLLGGPPQFADLRSALQQNEFRDRFLIDPFNNAMVRDTITPTVISAGNKINVIPAQAQAEIDCRLLPGDNPADYLKKLQSTIADDQVKLQVIMNFVSPTSPSSTNLMKAISDLAQQQDPGVPVVPTLSSGFTDSRYLRERKLIVYGFTPIELTAEAAQTIHGANERIAVANFTAGLRRMVALLQILGS
jgi:acetylornithine deacetylase/succinyl-diaminopimelate desuccinylase-like protein